MLTIKNAKLKTFRHFDHLINLPMHFKRTQMEVEIILEELGLKLQKL